MENNQFYFCDLNPIFKVAGRFRLLDIGLSARYLLNEWMDFDQTCTAVLLRQRQELIRFFVTLIPFSRLHKDYDFRKWLVSTLSHWGMDEFWPKLHIGGGHTFSSENTVLVNNCHAELGYALPLQTIDPDQLASSEANRSESALFAIKCVSL